METFRSFFVIILICLFTYFVTFPFRNICIVYWVYGKTAYVHDGIRVLRSKPIKFSNGELVPLIPDVVTAISAFIAAIALALLVDYIAHIIIRFYNK